MNAYLHINLEEATDINFYIIAIFKYKDRIKKQKIHFEAKKVTTYSNLIFSKNANFEDVDFENVYGIKFNFSITNEPIYTLKQLEMNKKYNIVSENELHYALEICKKSDKLLVTFPGYIDLSSDICYPITFLQDIDDSNKLIFQDRYHKNGTYCQVNDKGKYIFPLIIEKIKNTITELAIQEENVVFFGTSKGELSQ